MTYLQQLKEAFILAPLSLRHIKQSSGTWLAIYFVCGLSVFSLFAWQLQEHQGVIKSALLDYFFPKSWHEISEQLATFLFESQTKVVIGNLILGASLVLASIFLFPIKEKYSAEFEKDANFQNGSSREFPLLMQAWEETKLLLFYVTAQLVILWIGYYPYTWAKWTSITLSYLFLFFTFGLDFISPTLQRHRLSYSLILKFMFSRPLIAIAFGTLFSLPVVLLSRYIFSLEDLTLIEIASILFLTNILFLTLAVPTGTRIASQLMPEIRLTQKPSRKSKYRWYGLMLVLLVFMSFLHGRLITSVHHKSQILKANYDVDWSSFDFKLPSLNQFLDGEALTRIKFDVVIENPTEFDIVIENSQIVIEKKKQIIATVDLIGFEIPAGQSRKVGVSLDSKTDMSLLTNYKELLDDWRVDLHLDVWPGIPFVVNIAE